MFDFGFFWDSLFNLGPAYGSALVVTIVLAIAGQVLGSLLGLVLGVGRLSKRRSARVVTAVYVWLFRGIPELVLMVLLFTGLASAGIFRFRDMSLFNFTLNANMQAAIVALALREGAYMAEIVRNGVQSVDARQVAAAKALGMSPSVRFRKVVLPQALRVIVPPLGNDFNVMLKVTTLASVIGVQELFLTTDTYGAATFRYFELFVGLGINYLLLTTAWSLIQSAIEVRLSRHEATASGISGVLTRLRVHLSGVGATGEPA